MLRRVTGELTATFDAAPAPSGLSITQVSIMRRLARLGPLPPTRLASEAALDWSTMGRNLDPPERLGLVRVEVGEADQRERVAHLTASGAAAIETALPYWREVQQNVTAIIDPFNIGSLAEQLGALRRA
jgi:DNA-binding MarR family transcriptional regulator